MGRNGEKTGHKERNGEKERRGRTEKKEQLEDDSECSMPLALVVQR